MLDNKIYKDPKRKVGSQSEIPSLLYNNNSIIIKGYQQFTINLTTKTITYHNKPNKFTYIDNLLDKLHKQYYCNSIIDIGCNSGLVSLLASKNSFNNIISLDHDPEYIGILTRIKKYCNITNIQESVFSFGDKINNNFDIVFCGAIIHWIFSLTANFRNFDSIIEYLILFTNKFLLIEWISENDNAIKSFNHIKRNQKSGDEEYNTQNFEKSLVNHGKIISKNAIDGSTRVLYILQKYNN